MDLRWIIALVITGIGIAVLFFRRPLGDNVEENWGNLMFGAPPGYAKASVALLGFVLTLFGVISFIQLLFSL